MQLNDADLVAAAAQRDEQAVGDDGDIRGRIAVEKLGCEELLRFRGES